MPSLLMRYASLAVLAALLWAGPAVGRAGNSEPPPKTVSVQVPLVVDAGRQLAAGDEVLTQVVEDREPPVPRVVNAGGEINLPPLGPVRIQGKTAAEAAELIKKLLEKDYYNTATVRISIIEGHPGWVVVSGTVKKPGPQMLTDGKPLTLTKAIRNAGFSEWADLRTVKLRHWKEDGTEEVSTVNVKTIIEAGEGNDDLVLQNGDRIFVPKMSPRF